MAVAQRRVGQSLAILLASFLALAAFSLLTARPGDAAATWVVTFSGSGASPTNIKASKGDVIVFKNNLPLNPLTGALVPVNVNYGGEQFAVGGAPVARSITRSNSFTGSYAVLGLIPLTHASGSVTMTKAAPAPAPPPPPPPPATGGGGGHGTVTPPPPTSEGGGTVTPPHTTVPQIPVVVPRPRTPAGVPGSIPGNAAIPGAAAAHPPTQQGGAATGPKQDSGSVITAPPQGGSQAANAGGRSLVSNPSPSSAFGLAALTGVVLLLGVGTALIRAMLSGRSAASPTVA
jgi:hypothetical protein